MSEKPSEISLSEAAELLGVSKRRVQAITADKSGRLPVVRVVHLGKLVVHYVRRADVERLAAQDRPRGRPKKDAPTVGKKPARKRPAK